MWEFRYFAALARARIGRSRGVPAAGLRPLDAAGAAASDHGRWCPGSLKPRGRFRPGRTPRTPTATGAGGAPPRSEEHTSELQSLMRSSYAVFCLKKNNKVTKT